MLVGDIVAPGGLLVALDCSDYELSVREHQARLESIQARIELAKKRLARTAQLIRDARRIDAGRAVAMRDAWRERLAICTVDGGLTSEDAEEICLAELEMMLH